MFVLLAIAFLGVGIVAGAFGSLIGAGGGFIVIPILLIAFPDMSPEVVTAISITTVFFNSTSGSVAYARMKRIDYKTGIIFAVATLPGVIIGTYLTFITPRGSYDLIYGGILILMSILIIAKSRMGDHSAPYDKPGKFRVRRILLGRDGEETAFSFNMMIGRLISIAVGFFSGFLGIGGGIIHVPVLIFMGFPTHFATATSLFVLIWSSLTSVSMHMTYGLAVNDIIMALCIAVGAIIGAQIGARVSSKIKGSAIMKCLAVALILASIRIFVSALV